MFTHEKQTRYILSEQQNTGEKDKKTRQRRKKHKQTNVFTSNSQHSTQENSKYEPLPISLGDSVKAVIQKVPQQVPQRKQWASRRSRDTVDVLHPVVPDDHTTNIQRVSEDADSDSDLSDTERTSVLPSGGLPPQLELRPEVIQPEECSSHALRRSPTGYNFPDFLPPPFNSWSVGQLSVFYSSENRGALRCRPVGPLEKYLERLMELEWRQIQTILEERGNSPASSATSGCHRPPKNASSRLSSPKCILQCQRAFPLTFLSSLAHSTMLSCQVRHTSCGLLCCRSQNCPSRPGLLRGHQGKASLPKRSYSESRVQAKETSVFQPPNFSSSVRTNGHMRRMQALGNIRNPVQAANSKPARSSSASRRGREHTVDFMDNTTDLMKRRSVSERRRSAAEKQPCLSKSKDAFQGNNFTQSNLSTASKVLY
nr:uncharacterized protein LOC131106267 isoform X2 [Doryrhamphus excisus]